MPCQKYAIFGILLPVTTYEQIYDEAIGNNGIITARHARELGIPAIALVKLCKRGRLTRIGHGVYRIDKFFPQETDLYAAAVARVGEGAYVIGESVIGYYKLCPTHEANDKARAKATARCDPARETPAWRAVASHGRNPGAGNRVGHSDCKGYGRAVTAS